MAKLKLRHTLEMDLRRKFLQEPAWTNPQFYVIILCLS